MVSQNIRDGLPQVKKIHPSFRKAQKGLRPGVIFYHLFYKPLGEMKKILERGIWESFADERCRKQMENVAYRLPPLPNQTGPTSDIHFLTGKKFWYQTVFCAYSMALHAKINLRPVIYDDGTLTKPLADAIKQVFPSCQIVFKRQIDEQIETHLPAARFPFLRERRINYPNIRKITDVHAGSSGWKLVLDSDMLIFSEPLFLTDWLRNPQRPCHAVDVKESYGYSRAMMEKLAGYAIAEKLNVGICGLRSEQIDWEKLEFWCKSLIEMEGTSYYLEQALVAMLLAGNKCDIAPADKYLVKPCREEAANPTTILHHYVDDSRPWCFRYGWRRIVDILN